MLNLLMRFYDPTAGFIAIDGHDLRAVTQASLRSRMGVVLQENSLFNISVRENIRLGKPDASEEAIIEVAKAVGLHDFIMTLPHGYGTLAGEHGVRFSRAQMPRLAMARAMLRDPEILLLDEATSALDPVDELEVSRMIRSLAKGRTLISVSHRLRRPPMRTIFSSLTTAASSSREATIELMAANGAYAVLWRKQAGFTFSADGTHVDVDARRLKAFPILENLDDDQLAELAPFFATETFQPGREIVRQNDPGDKFYIIARGKVEVWRTEEQSGSTTAGGGAAGRRLLRRDHADHRFSAHRDRAHGDGLHVYFAGARPVQPNAGTVSRSLRRRVSEVAVRRLRESSKATAG